MSRHAPRFNRTVVWLAVSLLAVAACTNERAKSANTPPSVAATVPAPSTGATSAPPSQSVDTSTTTATDLGPNEAPTASFSVDAANGTVTLDAKPVKVVSLSPTATEMLFAIGAGAQVAAVDDQSNYPAEAAAVKTDLSGFTPNVEAIAGYQPDLVVIADDFNGLGAQLAAVGIPVWSGPTATSLDDVYRQIEQLGVLTGRVAEAAGLVASMQSDIEKVLSERTQTETPLTYYHELDPSYFSVTSDTFIGQLYSLVGLQNIADSAGATSSYPQLSSEVIVSANPDLIFLADTKCCGETPATVAARDGWATIAAVRNAGVISMDDDLASRWGPRVVDYLRAIVVAVNAASLVAQG